MLSHYFLGRSAAAPHSSLAAPVHHANTNSNTNAKVAPLVVPTSTGSLNSAHLLIPSKTAPPSLSSTASSLTLKLGTNRVPRPSTSGSGGGGAATPTSTSTSSLSITIPSSAAVPPPTSSYHSHSPAASNPSSYSSVSSAMLIASAARAAGDLSLAPVAHSPSRASPVNPTTTTPFNHAHSAGRKTLSIHHDLLVHGGSSDLDDQIDRLCASIRLALHWAVNTAIHPHTRRLYYEYRPPMVADITNGAPPAQYPIQGYPVLQSSQLALAGAGGRVLRRDAVAELQSLHRLYASFLAVPPSDPVAQRSFSFSIRSILSYYTDLLVPLALPSTTATGPLSTTGPLAATTPLTLDERGLQEPCSVAALAALLDLLVLIGQSPLPKTQFASNVDDPRWVEATANGLAATLVHLSQPCPRTPHTWWLPAHVPPATSSGSTRTPWTLPRGPHVDDARAVLDALCGLARFAAARAATATGNPAHRGVSVMVGAHVRKLARTHLNLCVPAAPAQCASPRRARHGSSPRAVHVHGGDWDPASVMEDLEDPPAKQPTKRSSSPHAAGRRDSGVAASESDSDTDTELDSFMSDRVALAVRATRLALLLTSPGFPSSSSSADSSSGDFVDDAIAHWDALSAAHYFVPLTLAAAPGATARSAQVYQYSTAELARVVEALSRLVPLMDPVRRAMLKSPLAAAVRELANRQVVRGADRLAVGGFVCRARTSVAAATGKRPWVSSPLAPQPPPRTPSGKSVVEECAAHHVPIVAEAVAALVVVVAGLRDKAASGSPVSSSPGTSPEVRRGALVGGDRAWSPPLV